MMKWNQDGTRWAKTEKYSWLQNDRPLVMAAALQRFVCLEEESTTVPAANGRIDATDLSCVLHSLSYCMPNGVWWPYENSNVTRNPFTWQAGLAPLTSLLLISCGKIKFPHSSLFILYASCIANHVSCCVSRYSFRFCLQALPSRWISSRKVTPQE